MKTLLLLTCFLSGNPVLFAQTKSATDTIPVHLIPLPEPVSSILPIDTPPFISIPFPNPYPWPGEIYPITYPITSGTFSIIWTPSCGETRHENGRLASRVECKNGIQHGRTTFWDEKGNKTNESYYLKGKLISTKSWNEKHQMTVWQNYNGAGQLHGKSYIYDTENQHKVVTSYRNENEHGKHLEFDQGRLTLCSIYRDGELLESTHYHSNGTIMDHISYYSGSELINESFNENGIQTRCTLRDSSGRLVSETQRNDRGVTIMVRTYKDGVPFGTWIDNYDDQSDKKKITEYNSGRPSVTLETEKGRLVQKTTYNNGTLESVVGFYENGDSSHYIFRGIKNHTKIWSKEGILLEDYYHMTSGYLADKGFITYRDTVYRYDLSNRVPDIYSPVKVWVTYRGDTLRMDYITNDMHFYQRNGQCILTSNYYAKDPRTGRCVENGIWKYYDGNKISYVLTYNYGIKEGRAIYYSNSENPTIQEIGFFKGDKRTGEWIKYAESGKETHTYVEGEQTGPFALYYPSGKVKTTGTKVNSSIFGQLMEYYENSVLKSETTYADNKPYGYQKIYNNKGQIHSEGNAFGNLRAGKWYFYQYRADGKVKRTKYKYSSNKDLRNLLYRAPKQITSSVAPIASL